jgi:uncharacterized membrane protein YagU involved in acid resistance
VKPNVPRAIVAGLAGTAAMTMMGVFVAPMMGMPRMNPAELLAGQMGGNAMLGWAGHLMIGSVLAILYAAVAGRLPGPTFARGMLFALAPWLMAQVVMMPMMGMGFFSGSMVMAGGSLLGHLLYGAVVGGIYGGGSEAR